MANVTSSVRVWWRLYVSPGETVQETGSSYRAMLRILLDIEIEVRNNPAPRLRLGGTRLLPLSATDRRRVRDFQMERLVR